MTVVATKGGNRKAFFINRVGIIKLKFIFMKKLILGSAFMLIGAFSFASDYVKEEILATDCVQLAWDVDDAVGGLDYDTFTAIIAACENQQQ